MGFACGGLGNSFARASFNVTFSFPLGSLRAGSATTAATATASAPALCAVLVSLLLIMLLVDASVGLWCCEVSFASLNVSFGRALFA